MVIPADPIQEEAIRAEIKANLLTAGAQNVFEEYRNPQTISQWISDNVTADKSAVETWSLWCVSRIPQPIDRQTIRWHLMFTAEMYYGYKQGSSETEAQALANSVCYQFQDKRSLGGWSTDRPLAQTGRQSVMMNKLVEAVKFTFSVTVLAYQVNLAPT